ncbi:hypothetical protein PoB_000229800 [Plakobranchus ocellatus]|uniref:Uncharacterized protein n=1 Tax=Plakobranchus ocellatus TaxID=259542 RepID=A0AAV3Y008_9GAST|nr:hypothetical protein PoB_000229800 [Plakobranchus ocellatus]
MCRVRRINLKEGAEFALKSAETLLPRVQAPPPAPWPEGKIVLTFWISQYGCNDHLSVLCRALKGPGGSEHPSLESVTNGQVGSQSEAMTYSRYLTWNCMSVSI